MSAILSDLLTLAVLFCYVDSHIAIGRVVLNEFENAVALLINSSLALAVGKY